MAYSNQAQLCMLADDADGAVESGTQAIDLAERLGETEILVHALNNVGSAEAARKRPGGVAKLERSLALALDSHLEEHVARGYTNLGAGAVRARSYARAERDLSAGIAYCEEHDLDSWVPLHDGMARPDAVRTGPLGRGRRSRDAGAAPSRRGGRRPGSCRSRCSGACGSPRRSGSVAPSRRGARAGSPHRGAAAARPGRRRPRRSTLPRGQPCAGARGDRRGVQPGARERRCVGARRAVCLAAARRRRGQRRGRRRAAPYASELRDDSGRRRARVGAARMPVRGRPRQGRQRRGGAARARAGVVPAPRRRSGGAGRRAAAAPAGRAEHRARPPSVDDRQPGTAHVAADRDPGAPRRRSDQRGDRRASVHHAEDESPTTCRRSWPSSTSAREGRRRPRRPGSAWRSPKSSHPTAPRWVIAADVRRAVRSYRGHLAYPDPKQRSEHEDIRDLSP